MGFLRIAGNGSSQIKTSLGHQLLAYLSEPLGPLARKPTRRLFSLYHSSIRSDQEELDRLRSRKWLSPNLVVAENQSGL